MINYINEKCMLLVKKHKTNNPFLLAEELGIIIKYSSNLSKLKGMYTVIKRNRFVFLNSNNDFNTMRIVLAHEIGHDQLHRCLAKGSAFSEYSLYGTTSKIEYEANIFASNLLMPDEDILNYIGMGYDSAQIACLLNTDINLVALKVSSLIKQGYSLNNQEYTNNFLK